MILFYPKKVKLRDEYSNQPNVFKRRENLILDYILELNERDLLQNFYLEAGMPMPRGFINGVFTNLAVGHNGWEHPASLIRGHFLGHYLSAVSRFYALSGDLRLKYKIDFIIGELKMLQVRNGGKWIGSIPEKYFHLMAQGEPMWAPHYVVHKTMMGLYDAYKFAGNNYAIKILTNFAEWFIEWTKDFSIEKMDEILDYETGAMMEAWADLYSVSGCEAHLNLAKLYYRRKLFNELLAGRDAMTNRHANTTIPEAHGAARLYEITGDKSFLDVAVAYWDIAVTKRGYFVTGACNNEEMWVPPFNFASRLGPHAQEHCNVYNMIRLADYLFRATGKSEYLDFIELSLYNGLLAQQNGQTGMVTYYLPLAPGSRKSWSTKKDSFWCCCGTLLQANASYNEWLYYQDNASITVAQYIPSILEFHNSGVVVKIEQYYDMKTRSVQEINVRDYSVNRPESLDVIIDIDAVEPCEFDIRLRIPKWISSPFQILIDGQMLKQNADDGFVTIKRRWFANRLEIKFPWKLESVPLPDKVDMVAFRQGPIAYAGLCGEERILHGDKDDTQTLFCPFEEGGRGDQLFLWHQWYKSCSCENGFILKPLYEITDEIYNVYFPVKN